MTVQIEEGKNLAPLTWYKIGGMADYYAEPRTIEEVLQAAEFAREKQIVMTLLGQGTNVLVSDNGIRGLTICLRSLNQFESKIEDDRLIVTAEAGLSKAQLAKLFLKEKLAPAIFLSGVPGDLGGGLAMNAGVSESIRPREFTEIVDWFEIVDLADPEFAIRRIEHDQILWQYRKTRGWQPGIIVRVELSWPYEPDLTVRDKMRAAMEHRSKTQPLEFPSCGSVFMNPPGHKSGQLIESVGLKGFQYGGAQISSKHANFIINNNSASASDVLFLIRHAQKTVLEKTGVQLHPEVQLIGDWPRM